MMLIQLSNASIVTALKFDIRLPHKQSQPISAKRAPYKSTVMRSSHCAGGSGGGYIGGSGSDFGNDSFHSDSNNHSHLRWILKLLQRAKFFVGGLVLLGLSSGTVFALSSEAKFESNAIWEVKDERWIRYVMDTEKDEFVVDVSKPNEEEAAAFERNKYRNRENGNSKLKLREIGSWFSEAISKTMLPVGYPSSVTDDYMEYTLWRMGQVVASQISGVLTTQALLYAVGLGKGAIPTAAAINWVLKDGIGYLSKILLSKYGRHFDVHPKGWRLFADLIENTSNGLELLTPAFPHLFVALSAMAGAGKSSSGLIQAATRSCFYAGFAAQQNSAEVIAKGEAQGMVSKSIGIALGIAISSRVGSSGALLAITYAAVTSLHMLCNWKSYQAVQLRTLNTFRTGILVLTYLKDGKILSVKDVNSAEPIFMIPEFFSGTSSEVSGDVRKGALAVEKKVKLGVGVEDAVWSRERMKSVVEVYKKEEYILVYGDDGDYKVMVKENASPHDMLKAVVQASYLHEMIEEDRTVGDEFEIVRRSYERCDAKFDEIKREMRKEGWVTTQGLVCRPLSNRIVSIQT